MTNTAGMSVNCIMKNLIVSDMVPKNNKEEFIKRYGNWWYLREFDFLPENLANYEQNMTAERMEIALSYKKPWAVYGNYHDAVVDFYNEHHFDYRGLIPIGLALEAPEHMYKHFGDMNVVVTSIEHKDKL